MGEVGRRLAVVVETDADVAELVRAVLVRADFDVLVARGAIEGLEAVRSHAPALTVVAVGCGELDGHEVARTIRGFSSTHVLLLADSADQVDHALALDTADAVAVKPVRPRTLRASIEEALRQPLHQPAPVQGVRERVGASRNPWGQPPEDQRGSTLVHPSERPHAVPSGEHVSSDGEAWVRADGLDIDLDDRSVQVDGRPVELTRTEFDLLAALAASGRRVRSKADLVLTLRGQSFVATYFVSEADKRAVEVHLANIRRKLGDVGPRPRWIETVRGVGYRMADG